MREIVTKTLTSSYMRSQILCIAVAYAAFIGGCAAHGKRAVTNIGCADAPRELDKLTIAAYIVGKVLMRLSGIAASIATFAVLAVIIQVYSNWDSVTGAQSSVVGIPIVRVVWRLRAKVSRSRLESP